MGYLTGHDGAVNGAATVRLWRIEPSGIGGPFAGSGTSGAVNRIAGPKDWQGRYAAYGHTPLVMPGAAFAFVGSENAETGVYGTAIVRRTTIEIEIPQEEDQPPTPIGHIVEFEANGTLNRGVAIADDIAVPNPPNPKDLKIQYATPAAVPSWSSICSAYRARLSFACRNPLYRPGCSSGQTFRLAGNVDANLEFEMYESDMSSLPTEGSPYSVRVYVTSTLFWEINWFNLERIAPYEVPIERRGLIYANLQWAFKSTTTISDVATRGSIKKPDTTTWWPTA